MNKTITQQWAEEAEAVGACASRALSQNSTLREAARENLRITERNYRHDRLHFYGDLARLAIAWVEALS